MTEAIATEGGENEEGPPECMLQDNGRSAAAAAGTSMCRKEKRKALKKEKRKQRRKELAEKVRQEEEARINDQEEQRRIQEEEEREKERMEIGRREFEERERLFLEALAARRKAEEEEEERRKAREEEEEAKLNQAGHRKEFNENDDDDWEYVEEGPPEIIWQGNEIIVRKKKVKVKKKDIGERIEKEDPDRPTSNPLPPQSEAFADYRNASSTSAQLLLENVAQQIPNFGTEQDKAHCPFHLKTGACRFGLRCSRVHFYPDKSCTLLIKNMYNGPGLAWEQDEGLEHTDEEIERCYEEFYEDVHTEFLKFGEIINFKVCRNGAYHLRGNVYVHYKSLDSALLAYHSINGRYFAARQVKCEFVGVTRWRVAICGEYMKSRLKTCSRGTACNFIHCFRNPGGDYEWADWDKPPPKYWVKKMISLFGYSDDTGNDKQTEQESSEVLRYQSKRSQSRERHGKERSSRDQHGQHDDIRRITEPKKHLNGRTKQLKIVDQNNYEDETNPRNDELDENRSRGGNDESDEDWQLYRDRDEQTIREIRKSSRHQINVSEFQNHRHHSKGRGDEAYSDENFSDKDWDGRFNDRKNSSKHRQKVVKSVKDFVGSKNSTRADSRRSRLDDGKYRDWHYAERNKSSKHQHRVSVSPDDYSNRRSRSRNYDDSVDWSDEDRGRRQTSPRYSSKRFSSSRETSEADARCDSEEDMDRGFRSDHAGKRKRPRRKLFGDDHLKSESPDAYDGRSKYHSRLHADVSIDERGRWEPEDVPEEHLYV